jgi:hypothetical protein
LIQSRNLYKLKMPLVGDHLEAKKKRRKAKPRNPRNPRNQLLIQNPHHQSKTLLIGGLLGARRTRKRGKLLLKKP